MGAPFDQMVNDLGIIAKSASTANRSFINLSAGVNWRPAEKQVISLLKRELDLSMTTRNYGNAGGTPAVTRILESLEDHIHSCHGLAVSLSHGTTEGSTLALDCWFMEGQIRAGDGAMAIGHSFGLYHRLTTERALHFYECLGDENNINTFMPSEQVVAEKLKNVKPRVIYLLLPNNPLGEIVDLPTLNCIINYIRKYDARLLVDRVCLMPWDDSKHVQDLIGSLVLDGLAMITDSFSKGESLAGLRMGYVVSNASSKARIVERIKSRYLNPPVFGSATLALTRVASQGEFRARRYLDIILSAHDRLFGEYPPDESFLDFLLEAKEGLSLLETEKSARRQQICENFEKLRAVFGNRAMRTIRLDGGFNVALALEEMGAQREVTDHLELAQKHGLGILTSHCFCVKPVGSNYFVRIGLTLPKLVFEQGLERLSNFYKN